MALDIPLCRIIKGQKTVIFWTKDLQYSKVEHKSSFNHSFHQAPFEKRNS